MICTLMKPLSVLFTQDFWLKFVSHSHIFVDSPPVTLPLYAGLVIERTIFYNPDSKKVGTLCID